MREVSWREAVKNAEAYKQIGETDIFLFRSGDDFPWMYAVDCEPGGSHRIDISTDVRFIAKHPCGLIFRWSFDIEDGSANGKSYYEIRTEEIGRILAKIPADCASKLRKYLGECSSKVQARGDEYQAIATKQYGEAAVLKRLSEVVE